MDVEYSTHEFCQEMRRRLSVQDIFLNEKQAKMIYDVVFDVLQYALIEHQAYSLPNICKMVLKRGRPRQYGVQSYGKEEIDLDEKQKNKQTVVTTSIWLHAKMNKTFNKMLRQSKALPFADPRLVAAVKRIEEVDDYVPEQFDGPPEVLVPNGRVE